MKYDNMERKHLFIAIIACIEGYLGVVTLHKYLCTSFISLYFCWISFPYYPSNFSSYFLRDCCRTITSISSTLSQIYSFTRLIIVPNRLFRNVHIFMLQARVNLHKINIMFMIDIFNPL